LAKRKREEKFTIRYGLFQFKRKLKLILEKTLSYIRELKVREKRKKA
jgi:hypothetical protein